MSFLCRISLFVVSPFFTKFVSPMFAFVAIYINHAGHDLIYGYECETTVVPSFVSALFGRSFCTFCRIEVSLIIIVLFMRQFRRPSGS